VELEAPEARSAELGEALRAVVEERPARMAEEIGEGAESIS
jgi:hypothetical protein